MKIGDSTDARFQVSPEGTEVEQQEENKTK